MGMTNRFAYMDTLYVLRLRGTDFVKIGFTTKPIEKRLAQIRTYCPAPIEIVVAGDGSREMERAHHRRLRQWHSHGEWFKLTRDVMYQILAEDYGLYTEEDMARAEAEFGIE